MLNADLTLSTWYSHRNLDKGMYGVDVNDPTRLESPADCKVRPRLITLSPGQFIYRWVDSDKVGPTHEDKACGPWWSTKRGAMEILQMHQQSGGASTGDAARVFSNIAFSFAAKLDEAVCVRVIEPVRCFLGVGKAVTDPEDHGGATWDSRGRQLYIPFLGEKDSARGVWTMTAEARRHLSVEWVKTATTFAMEDWQANMGQMRSA